MAVSNVVLKKIIKESCRSLSFDNERQQFYFQFYPNLTQVWKRLKPYLHANCPEFYLDDYNALLVRIQQLDELHQPVKVETISNKTLLNGEVLELEIQEINGTNRNVRIVKMKDGQYLDVSAGRGILFGSKCEFTAGMRLLSAEGVDYGVVRQITILQPTKEHVVVSRIFFGSYYLRHVTASLWPLFESAAVTEYDRHPGLLEELCQQAGNMGIQSWTFLNILKATLCR